MNRFPLHYYFGDYLYILIIRAAPQDAAAAIPHPN
jgi:hypothetical protein